MNTQKTFQPGDIVLAQGVISEVLTVERAEDGPISARYSVRQLENGSVISNFPGYLVKPTQAKK